MRGYKCLKFEVEEMKGSGHREKTVLSNDLASRLTNRIQLTSDGLSAYLDAVLDSFTEGIDYATLIKLYGKSPDVDKRYSPSKFQGSKNKRITGDPDPKHVSTSYVERNNLTMRMGMRRFTRLTNAFSKKIENLEHAVSLHFMYYNFARIHKTLEVTPAMAAGVTGKLWEIEDIVRLVDSARLDKTLL